MKKIILFTATCLCSTFAVQAAHVTHNINFGGGLGWGYGHFNYKAVETDPVAGFPTSRDFDLSNSSFAGNLTLGYAARYGNFMGGLEIDYLFMNLSESGEPNRFVDPAGVVQASSAASFKSNGAFGAALKMGYFFIPSTMAFMGIGLENRHFKVSYQRAGLDPVVGVPVALPGDSITKKYSQTAFAPRFGLESFVTPSVSVGAEYRKAFYGSKTMQNGTTTLKFKPRSVDTVLFTLKWNLNLSKQSGTAIK